MPLMKVPVNPTSDILSSVTAQSALSSKSAAWPCLSQPSLAQSLLPSPSPPLLSSVPQNAKVVRVPLSSNLPLTSITRTVSGCSLSSLASDSSRASAVPSPFHGKLVASPALPSRSDMASLRVTFKAPLKKFLTRVPVSCSSSALQLNELFDDVTVRKGFLSCYWVRLVLNSKDYSIRVCHISAI